MQKCLSTKSHAYVFCKKVSQTLHMRHLLFIFKQCGESDHSPIIIWKAKLPIGAAAPRKVNPFKAD